MPARSALQTMTSPAAATALDYNATVASVRVVHDDLRVLRVVPDGPVPRFVAGQYVTLGLGAWEPRLPGCQEEDPLPEGRLIRRAYSICARMLDPRGRIVRVTDEAELEFFIALVRRADRPPALTPRLFLLKPGDRLYLGPQAHGHYTLAQVPREADLVLAATGTGEAPHNAMLTELLSSGHAGRIVITTCARWRRDLAYLETHRTLERKFSNYRYLPYTTREPENLDPAVSGYVGKSYLQDLFADGRFEQQAAVVLDPGRTHVFLCGAPHMIGVPLPAREAGRRYPTPTGMVEVLERRGFAVDLPHEPGNIHFEKYW